MRVDRIRGLMTSHDWNQAELARQIGATQGSVQQILSGATSRSRLLPDIARAFGVNVHYLLGDTDDPTSAGWARSEGRNIDVVADDRVVAIREVNIDYGMGGGTFVDDYPEDEAIYLDQSFVKRLTRAPTSQLFMARGVGDSMQPTLLNSDTLLVDRSRKVIDQQDRIWALMWGEVGMVKRVRRMPQDRLLLMSDNPAVSPIEAVMDEVAIVGRVIWIARQI